MNKKKKKSLQWCLFLVRKSLALVLTFCSTNPEFLILDVLQHFFGHLWGIPEMVQIIFAGQIRHSINHKLSMPRNMGIGVP